MAWSDYWPYPVPDAVAPTRGVIVGLALSLPCWALLGALGRLLWGLVR